MKRQVAYIIVLLILLVSTESCKRHTPVIIDDSNMITIEVSDQNKMDPRSVIEEMELIPLETTAESLIGDVEHLFMVDDKIIVVDIVHSKSIFIFGRKGELIRRINGLGRGPNEYLNLSHVALTHDKQHIAAYDDKGAGILFYDLDGNLVSIEKVGFDLYKMEYADNNHIACTTYGSNRKRTGQEDSDYLIYFTNHRYNIESGIFRNRFDRDIFSLSPTLKKFNDLVYFNPVLSDTIYTANANAFIAKYRLDMSPINGFSNPRSDIDKKKIDDFLFTRPLFSGHFVDGDQYLLFNISTPPERVIENYIYDKTTGKTCKLEYNWNDSSCLFHSNLNSSLWASGNQYLAAIPAFAITMIVPEEYRKNNDALKNLTEDDNPVLVLYTLKTNTDNDK
ncbi:MAG: 6-bladed beta-propeller [Lachnoclostridium sp.]|jgi:hypothetical protein|nr:6-bladed beta-propeller [Lachnoclostridium sp.]